MIKSCGNELQELLEFWELAKFVVAKSQLFINKNQTNVIDEESSSGLYTSSSQQSSSFSMAEDELMNHGRQSGLRTTLAGFNKTYTSKEKKK